MLKELKKLGLSSNKRLQTLPGGLCLLKELEELDLSNCGLVALPEEIGGLVMLKKLDLKGNPLQSLPGGLGSLKELEELDLKGCDRLNLETAFVVALQELKCKVIITIVDPARPTLAELQARVDHDGTLDMSHCGLVALPVEIGGLVMLKKLDLCYNQRLELLPAGLWSLKELEELDLSNCDLWNQRNLPTAGGAAGGDQGGWSC